MNLQDLLERLSDAVKSRVSQLTESSAFVDLKEKYDGLSSPLQLAVKIGAVMLGLLILLWIPLSYIGSADEHMVEFNGNKEVLRDLLRVQRDKAQAPNIPPAPSGAQIKLQVADVLTRAGLAPEQIRENIETTIRDDKSSQLIPLQITQAGVQVTLLKLNLKQVVDIAQSFQSMNPQTKMMAMDMKANTQNDHYFDVMFRVVGFTTPLDKPEIIKKRK